ncbi:MAG: hypothetical protein HQL50_05680 [Magnetococcales bacterium]|nr:hypothetical protein [Magnetococcales bacterium]
MTTSDTKAMHDAVVMAIQLSPNNLNQKAVAMEMWPDKSDARASATLTERLQKGTLSWEEMLKIGRITGRWDHIAQMTQLAGLSHCMSEQEANRIKSYCLAAREMVTQAERNFFSAVGQPNEQ